MGGHTDLIQLSPLHSLKLGTWAVLPGQLEEKRAQSSIHPFTSQGKCGAVTATEGAGTVSRLAEGLPGSLGSIPSTMFEKGGLQGFLFI